MRILLLSGPVAVGKSGVAKELCAVYGARSIKSGQYLMGLAQAYQLDTSRASLQRLGDKLDQDTDYRWLIDDVATTSINSMPDVSLWLLDSVRKKRQVDHFRHAFGSSIFHAHLAACEETVEQRYSKRLQAGEEYMGNTPYAEAVKHPNEIAARDLKIIADLIVDMDRNSSAEAASMIIQSFRN